MFHQKYFCASGTQQQNQSRRCQSNGDFPGIHAVSAATITPTKGVSLYAPISSVMAERTSSFMDLRRRFDQQQFVLASSVIPSKDIDDRKDTMFVQSTPEEKDSTHVAFSRLGPLHLNPNLAQLPSSSRFFPSSDSFHSTLMQSENDHDSEPRNEDACSKTLAASDTDTATTATTACSSTSVASPTPSTLSNSSAMEEGAENSIEFVLDDIEAITNWNSRADIREPDEKADLKMTDRHWEEYKDALMGGAGLENSQHSDDELECSDFGVTDADDDDDACSCCTPVQDNTSRPTQSLPHQRLQRAFVRQESSSSSITRTTTTETKTTTTTTTKMTTAASLMDSSESVISATMPRSNCRKDTWHQSEVPVVRTPKDVGDDNAAVIPHRGTNSAVTTATTSAMTEQSRCCRSCIAKQRQIDLQRRELRHMKVMMKRLCLLLADTVRSQQTVNGAKQLPAPEGGDTVSLASSAATASSSKSSSSSTFVPALHTRRITSMPVATVGKDRPRAKNRRIQLNGQWGTYSGPSWGVANAEPSNGHPESNKENNGDEDETTPDAGIFQGCVVRFDTGDLYAGNLSRNDTGSFVFSPPGTLYDRNGKAMRRIR